METPGARVSITIGSLPDIEHTSPHANDITGGPTILDPGAALGLPSPGYPCYRQILKALGQRPHLIETSGQGRWMPTAADVHRLAEENAVGLLLASPNNPTGTMVQGARLAELAVACRERGLWLISDEIYHGLEYAVPAETAVTRTPRGSAAGTGTALSSSDPLPS